MYRVGRTAWGLVAIGAATAVGITTKTPGFIAITFFGTMVLPRVFGLTPRGWGRRGYGPHAFGPRGKAWGGGGCAGSQHGEVPLGKTFSGVLVDRVERIHQAVAERIGVHIERRMDEMRDIGPERFVARLELDRRAEAFALHVEP